ELSGERRESELAEDLETTLARGPAETQLVRLEIDRHARLNRGELAALKSWVDVGQERLTPLRRQLRRVRDQVLDRPVFADQLLCTFFTDPWYTFDVVDRVAHQRHHVDD